MNCINHPDRPRIAFCQNCGKPLCAECARVVGSAVFDEPCLLERLAASQTPPAGPGPFTAAPFAAGPMPPLPGAPNPVLALLLGFIPGVGAMYNGQYAKGVVHLIVFAILVSLADHGNGIFGLLVAGWVFYQVFEAYHTAKARRDGTMLPNPFGLNDLGERLGFGRSWGTVPVTGGSAPFVAAAPPAPGFNPGFSPGANPYAAADPATSGAQTAYSAAANPPYAAASPFGAGPGPAATPWGSPAESYPPYNPVAAASSGFDPSAGNAGGASSFDRFNRFPVGAVVLIALGVLFLIGNAGWIEGFPVYRLFPFLLIGLGVWLFARKMLESGPGLADDGSPQYRLRLLRAVRGSIWIGLIGVLSVLDSFRILPWSRSWPLFIIAAGVVAFLQRSAFAAAAQGGYGVPPSTPVPPSAPPPATPATTAIVAAEASPRDGEEV